MACFTINQPLRVAIFATKNNCMSIKETEIEKLIVIFLSDFSAIIVPLFLALSRAGQSAAHGS